MEMISCYKVKMILFVIGFKNHDPFGVPVSG
jgi:hypothetical protein